MRRFLIPSFSLVGAASLIVGIAVWTSVPQEPDPGAGEADLVAVGRQTFRFDTFGDEAFWGQALRLHETLRTLSPRAVLDLGLKVDSAMVPADLLRRLGRGEGLDDPAVTAQLLRANAVVGVMGQFDAGGNLNSVGTTCALCHSTVDDSSAAGVGRRLDGWANRDLNIGAIIAAAPNLEPIVELLRAVNPAVDAAAVRAVLNSWGPGKFDAELLLDGKTARPDGAAAATMLPDIFALAGHNEHTWTGGWGGVPYWNAFVATIEMGGVGSFFDPRLDDAAKFPVAAAAGFGRQQVPPEQDRVSPALPALHVYQLSLQAPRAQAGRHFDAAAAQRGQALFNGKASCHTCHKSGLWTDAGLNSHTPTEMGIDSFQADRSPDGRYRTANLAGLFIKELGLFVNAANKGRFYHDGRFATLADVVASYNQRFSLALTPAEQADLVEYLKSL